MITKKMCGIDISEGILKLIQEIFTDMSNVELYKMNAKSPSFEG